MNEVVLDRQGDLPAPSGFLIVASEVEFLRHATDSTSLLIRGERLCAWAEAFYRLRGRPFGYQESLSAALQRIFPALTQDQAEKLTQRVGQSTVSPEQVSAEFVLRRCYPSEVALWHHTPSSEHAARWLVWLNMHEPDAGESVVLQAFSDLLAREAGQSPESAAYRARNREQAKPLLHSWLGLGNRDSPFAPGEFPLELSNTLLNEIKDEWMKRLIASEGHYFEEMLSFPLPIDLRRDLAECAVQFYIHNSGHLTHTALWDLQPYLSSESLTALTNVLPPPEPSPLPLSEPNVLAWFISEYLPYRRWQANNGDERDTKLVHGLSHAFARWYLEHYPLWLLEPGWISFQHSARLLQAAKDSITLCVILDGLPAWDAEDFAGEVSAKVKRLSLEQQSYCFAPVPTVTEFAKEALLKGVPPRLTAESTPLGTILPDAGSPLKGLANAQPGDLLFWRIEQPDKAYHFAGEAKRERQVRAELESILLALKEVVEKLPANLNLHIIVTSDHGRLYNPKSPRLLSVPGGMQAHGRVAWGPLHRSFDESGFWVDEATRQIAIHGQRFGMTEDMLIAFGEESFPNDRSGYEPFPHGGLFPEEAIVPWFVYQRDAQRPSLAIVVKGSGEAEVTGTLTITITNPSQMAMECIAVSLPHHPEAKARCQWAIPPVDKREFEMHLAPWPTKVDLPLKATLLLRQANGATFSTEAEANLKVTSLYERDDSLLKDLGL